MDRVIAVVGPTAVGKTQVSLELASRLKTSIISGDSMLVYRGLNIGTAKPTVEEKGAVLHYLMDIRDPSEAFSVAEFKQLADECIRAENAAGKIPIIAGGTGLYIKALLEDYQLRTPPRDEALRQELQYLVDTRGKDHLYQMLCEKDPTKAASLHPNDVRRVIRALEIRMLTTDTNLTEVAYGLQYDCLVIGLAMEREQLYERINRRVETMIANRLLQEVEQLLKQGVTVHSQAMQAIGYKQMIAYLNGECSHPEAVATIKQATRHFAKRQMTWYRKMPYIKWVSGAAFPSHEAMMEHIYNLVAEKFGIE